MYNEQMTRKHVMRTKLLILPQFQLRLLGANLAIILLVAGVTGFQMNRAFSDLSAAAGVSGVEAEFYRNYLEFHAHSLNVSLWLAFATAIALSTLLTLLISHRFSGPIVRLRAYFRDLSQSGESIPQLNFRRNDELGDLPPL